MEELHVAGLYAIGGALAGGMATLLASWINMRWGKARKAIGVLAGQVASYHRLERIYLRQLSQCTGTAEQTLQRSARSEVEREGYERPHLSETDAKSLLRKWTD